MSDDLKFEAAYADCRHGKFIWPKADNIIGKSMALYGEWCEAELELMSKLLQPGNVVIESGANIGADTVPLSRMVGPEGHVFAFEPQPLIFEVLKTNLHINECTNVTIVCAGTSMVEATAAIPKLDYNLPNNFGGVSLIKSGLDGIDVPVVPLDDVVHSAHGVHLIKADVEGMELWTLMGASKIIGNNRPALYLENNLGPSSPDLIRFLQQINYQCWWHLVPIYSPSNWRATDANAFPGVVSCNMICLPAGGQLAATVAAMGLPKVLGPRDKPPGFRERPVRPAMG